MGNNPHNLSNTPIRIHTEPKEKYLNQSQIIQSPLRLNNSSSYKSIVDLQNKINLTPINADSNLEHSNQGNAITSAIRAANVRILSVGKYPFKSIEEQATADKRDTDKKRMSTNRRKLMQSMSSKPKKAFENQTLSCLNSNVTDQKGLGPAEQQ